MSEQMVQESDGQSRPWWSAYSVFRWSASKLAQVCTVDVTYQDIGRVVAGGRCYNVRVPDSHTGCTPRCDYQHSRVVGVLLVADAGGELYVTPDQSIDVSEELGVSRASSPIPYGQRRWVGGFANRGEALAYLRAHDHRSDPSWTEAQWQYPHRVRVTGT